jgi:hypothetical protein
VVVEGALSPPVRRVVPNGVRSLAVHLGNHSLLFFLESDTDASARRQGHEEPKLTPPRNTHLARQEQRQLPSLICTALEP